MKKRKILAIILTVVFVIGFLDIHGKNCVVNAYTIDSFVITFDGNGGTLEDPIGDHEYKEIVSGNYSIDGILSAYPWKGENNNKILMGYKVKGGDDKLYIWNNSFYISDEKTPKLSDYKVTGDVTFIAEWKDTHKVTFKYGSKHRSEGSTKESVFYIGDGMKIGNNGGWPVSSDEYTSVAYMKEGDEKTFYGGRGYNEFLQETKVSLSDYIVTEDVVFNVIWAKENTVSFDCNGGYIKMDVDKPDGSKTTQKETKVIGSAYTLEIGTTTVNKKIGFFSILQLESIKKDDGSVFKGWKKDGDSHIYTTDEIKNMTFGASTKFVAQWENKKEDNPPESNKTSYSNEWVDGKWYNKDGTQTYKGTMQWKSNATGWWIEDSAGWYPTNTWQKIDGTWYFFKPDGYMASGEYYNGYWFNKDGSWDSQYLLSWKSNETGWWVEDISGWWPQSSWLKIDGYWYYFDASGYMVTNQYIDGWWIGADGVCY